MPERFDICLYFAQAPPTRGNAIETLPAVIGLCAMTGPTTVLVQDIRAATSSCDTWLRLREGFDRPTEPDEMRTVYYDIGEGRNVSVTLFRVGGAEEWSVS